MHKSHLIRTDPKSQLTAEKKQELLARYSRMRDCGIRLLEKFGKVVTQEDMLLGAERIGVLQGGKVCVKSESESAVLMDYSFFEIWRDGQNVVERVFSKSPPNPESDEWECLQAMRNSVYSLFMVVSTIPGFGLVVRDMLGPEVYLLIDIGMGSTAETGLIFASRLFLHGEFAINSGATLPITVVSDKEAVEIEKKMQSVFVVDDGGHFDPALIIRKFLSLGDSFRIGYSDHRINAKASRQMHTVSQERRKSRANSACPCGSGKKYKQCCFRK